MKSLKNYPFGIREIAGGIKLSCAVNIQQPNNELDTITNGKNVNGFIIKSYPSPYILLDWVWIITFEVIYREKRFTHVIGTIIGTPAEKNTPMNKTKLKLANY